ncbi:cytochrome P450 [Apiospora saccharicola]
MISSSVQYTMFRLAATWYSWVGLLWYARVYTGGNWPFIIERAHRKYGKLAFDKSLGAVRNGESHTWVPILLGTIYSASVVLLKKHLRILEKALPWLAPKKALEEMAQHQAATLERVQRRIQRDETMERTDLLTHPTRSGKLNPAELANNAQLLPTAGAETSATTLTAITYLLATHPGCRARLDDEVRSAFDSTEQITATAAGPQQLPYLNAVLEEALRIFPPSPLGPPRVSPGETVDVHNIPRGIYVACDTYSLQPNPSNAPSPRSFHPERWLQAEKPYTAPFSIGPRACLGINLAYMELRIALAKIVYALDWEIVGGGV